MPHPRIAPTLVVLAALLSGIGIATAAESSGPVYKWVDDKGVIHYGDSVPPEYAQKERSVLNSQGVEVGHVEGGKSAAQAAEQAKTEEDARQRAQHDQFLLATYTSTKDIEQLRDERLAQIQDQIKSASLYIDSLDTRLRSLQERAQAYKPYSSDPKAHKMPDDLAEELVRASNENHTQHAALDAKRKELVDVRAQFDADVARYRELTSRHPASS